jgi:dipeptidyl aminopeptidase/acylaminoacyl peptidase
MRKIVMAVLVIVVVHAATTLVVVSARAEPAGPTATNVTFAGAGGVVLHGTVRTPASGAKTRHPALVLLGGAGNRLIAEARGFTDRGIVTLVYDQRTDLLAEDALAGVRLLRARPDVDPANVGLWAPASPRNSS